MLLPLKVEFIRRDCLWLRESELFGRWIVDFWQMRDNQIMILWLWILLLLLLLHFMFRRNREWHHVFQLCLNVSYRLYITHRCNLVITLRGRCFDPCFDFLAAFSWQWSTPNIYKFTTNWGYLIIIYWSTYYINCLSICNYLATI